MPQSQGHAQSVLNLPQPGTMVTVSPLYSPAMIKGIKVFPDNPLRFNFIIDTGDSSLKNDPLKQEFKKLIKYFLGAPSKSIMSEGVQVPLG